MLTTSKPFLFTFVLGVILGLSWANNSMASQLPGDTIVVEASINSLKTKNKIRSNGQISFFDTEKKLHSSTPFKGPAGYHLQKVSIPLKCQCPEVDSFEVTLIYTDLESCLSTLLYQKWRKLEGLKELQIIPQQSQKTNANYVLSIRLQPNRFPKDHNWREACFYLRGGLIASDYQYFMFEAGELHLLPAHYNQNGKYFTFVPKMKLNLFK